MTRGSFARTGVADGTIPVVAEGYAEAVTPWASIQLTVLSNPSL